MKPDIRAYDASLTRYGAILATIFACLWGMAALAALL